MDGGLCPPYRLSYDARGDYETALEYLKQSLKIIREIGDKSGLCATLFNIGHIHLNNKDTNEAMRCFIEVYLVARQIGEHQALVALAGMTKEQGGLEFWEKMVKNG